MPTSSLSPLQEQHSGSIGMKSENTNLCQVVVDREGMSEILAQIKSGQLFMVNSRRKNGLIIYRQYYAEFAGPGAAVGSLLDVDCQQVLPVGNLSLICPESFDDRQKAYLIRRQWIRLTQQITDNPVPQQRAQMILNQFENYFDAEIVAQLPDEAFALLVGILPETVRMVRANLENAESRVRS
jgi:hypothetical protein